MSVRTVWILFITLAILVNGRDTNIETEENWIEELVDNAIAEPEDAFADIDANADGVITRNEWQFHALDTNKDGSIDFDEFRSQIRSLSVVEMNTSIDALKAPHDKAVQGAVAGLKFSVVGGALSSTAATVVVGGKNLFVKRMDYMTKLTPAGIKKDMVYTEAGLEVAKREVKIQMMAAKNKPPLAPAIVDFWAATVQPRNKKTLFVAMEDLTVAGYESLRDLLQKADPAMGPNLAPIVSETVKAFGALHAIGISHGDPHPGNVMVLTTGPSAWKKVTLIDFGRAQVVAAGTPIPPDTDVKFFKENVGKEMPALYAKMKPEDKSAVDAALH